jgi:hypothetical protein
LHLPIAAILLLIALFTTVSGKPLDGFLMLTMAVLLVWDATRTKISASGGLRRPRPGPVASRAGSGWPYLRQRYTPALSVPLVAIPGRPRLP